MVCMTDVLHTPEQATGSESIPFSTTEALFLSAAIHGYVHRRHDELEDDKRDALLLVAIHARKAANASTVFACGFQINISAASSIVAKRVCNLRV